MITLKLTGVLGELFGTDYTFDVKSPLEATAALAQVKKGFREYARLRDFNMWINDKNVSQDVIGYDYGDCIVTLGVHVTGAGGGNGLWAVIAGIAIIIVAWWNPAGWLGATQMMAYGMGAGLAASGAAQLLMPTASVAAADQDGNKASYGFSGAVTTTEQGNIVPIAYGKCRVGGFVIMYRITTEDITS